MAAKAKGGLGKGLGALFEEATMESGTKDKSGSVSTISWEYISRVRTSIKRRLLP